MSDLVDRVCLVALAQANEALTRQLAAAEQDLDWWYRRAHEPCLCCRDLNCHCQDGCRCQAEEARDE